MQSELQKSRQLALASCLLDYFALSEQSACPCPSAPGILPGALQIVRQCGSYFNCCVGPGMFENDFAGVQPMPQRRPRDFSVQIVMPEGAAYAGKVDTDLMGTSCINAAAYQGKTLWRQGGRCVGKFFGIYVRYSGTRSVFLKCFG